MAQFQIIPEDFTVLIVDDTESNIRLLSFVLRNAVYKVMAAFDGKEALELMEQRIPDLILLDVLMPEISGFELCAMIKEREALKNIPVIFLSALTDTNDKIEGFKAGGVDYITKPFQKEETLARINTHLFLHQLQKERDERIETLRQREAELSRLNQRKDELVRIVSHDIQNPITGIVGLSSLLQKQCTDNDGEIKEMLAVIERSGQKLLHLVEQVLDTDHQKSSTETLQLGDYLVDELLTQVIDVNAPKAQLKKISLSSENNSEIQSIKVDKVKIDIALNNLVSNALKFTSTGGSVRLTANTEQKSLVIEVKDNGIGIPPQMIDKLFIKTSDPKSTYGTDGEIGSGLGLDVVQNYIHLHGGSITVTSVEHEGSTFRISLPIIE